MRKNIYTLLATTALSLILVTGCSSSDENKEVKTTTHHEASTECDTSTKQESTTNNTSTTTNVTTPSNETSSTDESTTSSTETKNEIETTTSSSNNNTGSSNNNSANNNNSNNNNSNNNNNNGNNNSNNGNVLADKNNDKITESYGNDTSSETKQLAQAIINKIITKNMSDFDKAKAIHDYMVMNIDYDYANYLADTIPNDSYNVIGALKNKYAVCAGYAKAFKLLCEQSGLECTYVTGTAGGPHAWNQVKIDGKWYNVDVTWDDPVSTDKQFNDHKYNRYSYFLISDELMYKDHKANGSVHSCTSSLHTKAYEVGAPWAATTYASVKDEASLSAVIKKAINSNSSTISIIWDTNWVNASNMSKKIKGMMLEYVANDFSMSGYSYVTIKNTSLCSATFNINLKNNTYTTVSKLNTINDIKDLIVKIKNGSSDQETVPMANNLVNDNTFYEAAVWAYKNHDVSVSFSETTIEINSTTKSVHVTVWENDYNAPYHNNEAYCIESKSDIAPILEKQTKITNNFRIVYRYGDELGRLSAKDAENYVKTNLAPTWASKYCYKNYSISFNDFICVMVIKFSPASHTSSGSSWEYSKEPTCITDGESILKCSNCHSIIQSHVVEATGVHDTYWTYNDNGSKHLSCKHCTYTGPTLYQFGDVWGYYDNDAAAQLFTSINKARETAIYYNIDPFGNLIGAETPPQLTLDNSLSEELNNVVLQAAWLNISNGGAYNFDPNIAIIDGNFTVERACSTFATATSHFRELFNNKYLTRAGVCCFYYDKDGTGLKMQSIWCIYYAE